MMKKEEQNKLRERWHSLEGQKLTKLLSKGFKKGKLPALDMVGSYNGRIDLRGLKLEANSRIRDISLENVDLSCADLDNAWIEGSSFLNVSFMAASMQNIADHGNIFKDEDFTRTDLRLAVLGYKGTSYTRCIFNNLYSKKPVLSARNSLIVFFLV